VNNLKKLKYFGQETKRSDYTKNQQKDACDWYYSLPTRFDCCVVVIIRVIDKFIRTTTKL